MKSVRVRGTAPELRVRRILREHGIHYRVATTKLPGSPDITNQSRRWCIFVHGCFWHGHACKRGRLPKSNGEFWEAKVRQNQERDQRCVDALRALGMRVVVVWQCELADEQALGHRLLSLLHPAEAASGSPRAERGHHG